MMAMMSLMAMMLLMLLMAMMSLMSSFSNYNVEHVSPIGIRLEVHNLKRNFRTCCAYGSNAVNSADYALQIPGHPLFVCLVRIRTKIIVQSKRLKGKKNL